MVNYAARTQRGCHIVRECVRYSIPVDKKLRLRSHGFPHRAFQLNCLSSLFHTLPLRWTGRRRSSFYASGRPGRIASIRMGPRRTQAFVFCCAILNESVESHGVQLRWVQLSVTQLPRRKQGPFSGAKSAHGFGHGFCRVRLEHSDTVGRPFGYSMRPFGRIGAGVLAHSVEHSGDHPRASRERSGEPRGRSGERSNAWW